MAAGPPGPEWCGLRGLLAGRFGLLVSSFFLASHLPQASALEEAPRPPLQHAATPVFATRASWSLGVADDPLSKSRTYNGSSLYRRSNLNFVDGARAVRHDRDEVLRTWTAPDDPQRVWRQRLGAAIAGVSSVLGALAVTLVMLVLAVQAAQRQARGRGPTTTTLGAADEAAHLARRLADDGIPETIDMEGGAFLAFDYAVVPSKDLTYMAYSPPGPQ